MEPISICLTAVQLAQSFFELANDIKGIVEAMKNASGSLLDLLNKTERMRLFLEILRSLANQLQEPDAKALITTFNDNACRKTISDIRQLVQEISKSFGKSRILGQLHWVPFQGKAQELIKRLKGTESEINTMLLLIITKTNIRTKLELSELHEQAVLQAEVVQAFGSVTLSNMPPVAAVGTPPPEPRRVAVWSGDVLRSRFDDQYLALRDALSNTSYDGDFPETFRILDIAQKRYGEQWINCIRLKPVTEAHVIAGWTPLHQAVYNCATVDTIKAMIDLGAFRTLRTKWTNPAELSYRDMTAIEIARELGYSHLYHILSPVIRHNVPGHTLNALEQRFHELIRRDCYLQVSKEHLTLPDLTVLTELENPEMMFPLSGCPGNDDFKGYFYRLDGRELLVRSCGTQGLGSVRLYRISTTNVLPIEEAIVFNRCNRS